MCAESKYGLIATSITHNGIAASIQKYVLKNSTQACVLRPPFKPATDYIIIIIIVDSGSLVLWLPIISRVLYS
jgi:hypothetical protein